MNAGHTVNLSENVSDQPNGIILHWRAYVDGAAQNYDHNYCFVPKYHITGGFNAGGIAMLLANSTLNHVTVKYVYVNDNNIKGNSNNSGSITTTSSGIKKEPNYFVLTDVYGV